MSSEYSSISNETHPEFIRLLTIITNERNDAISGAENFKNYQLEISRKILDSELEALEAEIQNEKDSLKDKMLINLEDKKRKLEFEFNSFEFNDGTCLNKSITTRKGRGASISNNQPKIGEEKGVGRKRKNQNVPILNFVLKEHEIYDDVSYFARMGISGRRGFRK